MYGSKLGTKKVFNKSLRKEERREGEREARKKRGREEVKSYPHFSEEETGPER